MEEWVDDWVRSRRANGETGVEVKKINECYYVYHSTSRWDKVLKRPIKSSKYVGKLDRELGMVPAQHRHAVMAPKSVWQYGNTALLAECIRPLRPVLEENFPDWREIVSLAMLRAQDEVPLKRAASDWDGLYDVDGIGPNLEADRLGQVLRRVGTNKRGQDAVFRHLAVRGQELIYDLSCFFTKSPNISIAERGYNKEHCHLPQINLALLCSLDDHLPTMLRALPGSVRDIASIYQTMEEVGLEGKTLIMDRGFFGEDVCTFLDTKKVRYVMPLKRNSKLYDLPLQFDDFLIYHDRLINFGRAVHGKHFLYRFQDEDLRLDEVTHLHTQLQEKIITRADMVKKLPRCGNILIMSSLDEEPEVIYELYKRREFVEDLFNTYKNVLNADRPYLRDTESIFGHVFVSFVSLYIYCTMQNKLRNAKLLKEMTPIDLLKLFGKVFMIDTGTSIIMSDVPKSIRTLDGKLGTSLFPKRGS
jgi:hypothetical protein